MELESEDDLKIALKKDRETMGHRYVEGRLAGSFFASFYFNQNTESVKCKFNIHVSEY